MQGPFSGVPCNSSRICSPILKLMMQEGDNLVRKSLLMHVQQGSVPFSGLRRARSSFPNIWSFGLIVAVVVFLPNIR